MMKRRKPSESADRNPGTRARRGMPVPPRKPTAQPVPRGFAANQWAEPHASNATDTHGAVVFVILPTGRTRTGNQGPPRATWLSPLEGGPVEQTVTAAHYHRSTFMSWVRGINAIADLVQHVGGCFA